MLMIRYKVKKEARNMNSRTSLAWLQDPSPFMQTILYEKKIMHLKTFIINPNVYLYPSISLLRMFLFCLSSSHKILLIILMYGTTMNLRAYTSTSHIMHSLFKTSYTHIYNVKKLDFWLFDWKCLSFIQFICCVGFIICYYYAIYMFNW